MDASMYVPELGPPTHADSGYGHEFTYGMPAQSAGAMYADPLFWMAVLLILWAGLAHLAFGFTVQAGAGE